MAFVTDRARRLESMGINDQARALLRDVVPLATQHLDSVIEDAYRLIMQYPEAARAYQGVSVEDIKKAQRAHWLNDLLPATFTEEQIQSAVALFQKRQKMGLSLRWYFSFYTCMLRGLIDRVAPAYRKQPEKLVKTVDALAAVVLFDLELASAAFMIGSQEDAAGFMKKSADELQQKVSTLAHSVSNSAGQLQDAAKVMSRVADATAKQVASASQASKVAEENIQSASAATTELTSSIHEISRQVGQSTQITSAAVGEAQRTNEMIQGLAGAVSKIGDVVKLINDIASQTNLLALNATIEAARAGEAGKGFAVVAGEVKNLANQTAKATDEISSQIGAVQTATKEAVTGIQGIGGIIGQISEIASAIAGAVEEQGAATQQISVSVHQAASSSTMVQGNVSSVDNSAREAESTARTLLEDAGQLMSGVQALQQEIGGLSGQVARFLEQTHAY